MMSDEESNLPKVEPVPVDKQSVDKKSKNHFMTTLVLMLILAQLGFSIFIYVDKEKQITSLKAEIADASKGLSESMEKLADNFIDTLYEIQNPNIDLTAKSYQPFGSGYGILIQEVEVLPNGKRIQGRIVNFDSVTVSEVELTFQIGVDSKDFVVDEISPGGSRKFAVTVVGQDALSKNTAKVIWNSNKFY
ncbi:MAG: hypothetical protein JZU65_07300 [Chlorobium sp.]|nr:hypothetical protein [Chlorobium sp.]